MEITWYWRGQDIGYLMRKATGVARRKPKRKTSCTAYLGDRGCARPPEPRQSCQKSQKGGWNCSIGVCADGFDLLWADLTLLKYHSSPWDGKLTLWCYMVGVCRFFFFLNLIVAHLKRLPRVSAETLDSRAVLGCLKGRVCTPTWKWDSRWNAMTL